MKEMFIILLLWFCISVQAQYNSSLNKDLSQTTNAYIYKATSGCVLISSIEGLNIFNGLSNRVYRSITHGIFGNIIQSPFFEDSTGKVWFTTYEALNCYNPRLDNLDYMFMVSSSGDTIKENYIAFHLEGN